MKAILVAVDYNQIEYDLEVSIEELQALCYACNIEVEDIVIQKLQTISSTTFIGSGKVLEIREMLEDIDIVVFNEELSPVQLKNLTDVLDIEVIDRSDLILRIFESRAKTKEAKLQVEIAKMNYMLPRLIGMNVKLYSQQGGKGFRGSGETKLELDRRKIAHKVTVMKRELELIKKERQVQRKSRKRNNVKTVALVGYTNSGKSSLLNYFTDKKVFEKDMLFATLQTSSRKVKIKKHNLIMSDTVGFINQLPHHLVQAFRSTLEEIVEADLILLVVDSHSYYFETQIDTTLKVLEELGVKDTPVLYVFNKIDLVNEEIQGYAPAVHISVKEKTNITKLENKIIDMLYQTFLKKYYIPYESGDIFTEMNQLYELNNIEYLNNGIQFECYMSQNDEKKYEYIEKIDFN